MKGQFKRVRKKGVGERKMHGRGTMWESERDVLERKEKDSVCVCVRERER